MGLRYQLARIEEALPFFVVDDFRFPQKPPLTACSLDRERQTETDRDLGVSRCTAGRLGATDAGRRGKSVAGTGPVSRLSGPEAAIDAPA